MGILRVLIILLPYVVFSQPGALDSSFSGDGKAIFCFDTNSIANNSILQNDGKIIITGLKEYNTSFACRVNSDGTIDSGFGNDGIVVIATNLTTEANSLCYSSALQNDGKIILVGNFTSFSGDHNLMVIRLNSNGSPDTNFGVNGKLNLELGSPYDFAYAVKIQTDGKILIGGSSGGVNGGFCLVRLLPSGQMDPSFGTNGMVVTIISPGNESTIKSLDLLSNGKIIALGNRVSNGTQNIVLAQYNEDGSLDSSFGTGGKTETVIETGISDDARNLKALPNGKLLIQGIFNLYGAFSDGGNMLLQYNSNGNLDLNFGTNGVVINLGEYSGYGLATQVDGKIVVSGSAAGESIVARYLPNGSYDNTFNDDGKVITSILDNHISFSSTVLVSNDNKIIVSGFTDSEDYSLGCVGIMKFYLGTLENKEFTSQHLKLYPNPADDYLNVNSEEVLGYTIYSVTGTKVKYGIFKKYESTIVTSDLKIGTYFLVLVNERGEHLYLSFIKK